MRRAHPVTLLAVALLLAALACSGSSTSGGPSSADDAGPLEGATSMDAGRDASAGDSSTSAGDALVDAGIDNGSCCVRNASDDAMCASRGEPSTAYVCFCPVGGEGGAIDPSCTVNMGTELVCCP